MRNDHLVMWVFVLLFMINISACMNSGIISTSTEVAPQISTRTLLPTAVLPIPTSTPTMTMWANNACWKRQFLDKVETKILGSLFYLDIQSEEYRLLNLITKKVKGTNFLQNDLEDLQVSYYGQYFSLLRPKNNEILLFSEDGEKTFSIPTKTYFAKYLNGSRILLGYEETDDHLYIMNLTTGDLTTKFIFKPDFPELQCSFGLRCNYRYASYSPDLRYVFYIANGFTNRLLDVSNQTLVENKAGGYSFGKAMSFPDDPVWKIDSSAVTIFDAYNYYNVKTNGEFIQLTHLENLLPDYVLMEGEWSPSGRYLAFMTYQRAEVVLYIFDAYTNTLINPCVSEIFDGHRHYWPIFWSPIGDMLALDIGGKARFVNDPPGSDGYRTVIEAWPDTLIVDIPRQSIYQVPSTMRNERQSLLGWLSWEIP